MKFHCGIVASLLVLAHLMAHADEIQKTDQQLAKAREKYDSVMILLRDDVLKQIENADATERKKGNPDLMKLEQLEADQRRLKQSWDFPGWLDAKTTARILKTREPMVSALVKAKAAYTRAKDEAKAAQMEDDLWKLLSRMPPAFEAAKRGRLILEIKRDGNVLTFAADGTFKGTGQYPWNKGTWQIGPSSQMLVRFADPASKGTLEQHGSDAVTLVGSTEKWSIRNPSNP